MENTRNPPGNGGLEVAVRVLNRSESSWRSYQSAGVGCNSVFFVFAKGEDLLLVQGFYVSGIRFWGHPLNLSPLARLQSFQYLRDKLGKCRGIP